MNDAPMQLCFHRTFFRLSHRIACVKITSLYGKRFGYTYFPRYSVPIFFKKYFFDTLSSIFFANMSFFSYLDGCIITCQSLENIWRKKKYSTGASGMCTHFVDFLEYGASYRNEASISHWTFLLLSILRKNNTIILLEDKRLTTLKSTTLWCLKMSIHQILKQLTSTTNCVWIQWVVIPLLFLVIEIASKILPVKFGTPRNI